MATLKKKNPDLQFIVQKFYKPAYHENDCFVDTDINVQVFSYKDTTIAVTAWKDDYTADFETLWKAQKVIEKLEANRSESRFIAKELRKHYEFQFVTVAKPVCDYAFAQDLGDKFGSIKGFENIISLVAEIEK